MGRHRGDQAGRRRHRSRRRAGLPTLIVDIALPGTSTRPSPPAPGHLPRSRFLRKDGAIVSETEMQAAAAIVDAELRRLSRSNSSWRLRRRSPRAAIEGQPGSRRRAASTGRRVAVTLDPTTRAEVAGPCVGRWKKRCCTRPRFGSGVATTHRTVTSTPRPCVNSSTIWTRPHRSPSPPSNVPGAPPMTATRVLRVGTRRSALASRPRPRHRGIGHAGQMVPIVTAGGSDDHRSTSSVERVFVSALREAALLAGDIDLAVHSARTCRWYRPGASLSSAVPEIRGD